mmetsp:Transcript_34845/g.80564  ORF Transcript_34845/g.80564 Transcript_34845/m.80564 type:complete len:118 (+) Transcript_34845:1482-1835(+)
MARLPPVSALQTRARNLQQPEGPIVGDAVNGGDSHGRGRHSRLRLVDQDAPLDQIRRAFAVSPYLDRQPIREEGNLRALEPVRKRDQVQVRRHDVSLCVIGRLRPLPRQNPAPRCVA